MDRQYAQKVAAVLEEAVRSGISSAAGAVESRTRTGEREKGGATGWSAYVPADGGPVMVPPSPWRGLRLVEVVVVGEMVIVLLAERDGEDIYVCPLPTTELAAIDMKVEAAAGVLVTHLARRLGGGRDAHPEAQRVGRLVILGAA